MNKTASAEKGRSVLVALTVLGLIAFVALLPSMFRSGKGQAQQKNPKQTAEGLEFYDIRLDKNANETLMNFRQSVGRDAVSTADARDKFVAGETSLRQNVRTLEVLYTPELGNANLIGTDVRQGQAFLASPTKNRVETLRNFLTTNNRLVGLTGDQINNLKVTADYTNPNGELSFTDLDQFIGDVPVFRSTIRAAFNKNGAMFRVINNSAPEIDYNRVSTEFGNPADAIQRAAGYLNYTLKQTAVNEATSTPLKVVFGTGDSATTAEKMYFPTEIGVARPAWRVLVWETSDAYYVIVDAETGAMLYRENITYHQTQPATFNVYAATNNLLKTSPNPAPLAAPGLLNPALGTQGTLIPRSNVTLIGNEAPNTFNNLGWITDNTNGVNGNTTGNNTTSGLDRDTTNGADSFVAGTNRVFNFNYTPPAGPNNTGGDDPLNATFQSGIVTNLFYVTNRYHDILYTLGFTEAARNFQTDNFGRGGAGNDRVLGEAQDNTVGSSCPTAPCYNNANFATPADGSSGRMQMYLWNAPTPDRDGDLDAEIIVHELTHGTFGRLHTGSISNTQAGQMNEGNSDFFAHVLLSDFNDPANVVSTTGAYATLGLRTAAPFSSNGNYYYGIRRFPKAVLAFTGGPNNRPHNPLTFADIDSAQMSLTDGAFAPAFTGSATAVHDGGEIWSSMMWEVRAKLAARLGNEAGNRKVLQLAADGMKVAPSGPTMITERNAIISAAVANGNSDDVGDIWAGFALRGMGFSATNPSGNTVTQAFDLPGASLADTGFAVSDPAPGGDNDGYAEPGETVQLTVPVTNLSGATISSVTAAVTNGGTANYGSIANGQTVSRQISYAVPSNAACGSLHTVTITVTSGSTTQPAQTRSFRLGAPAFSGNTQNFDGVTAPALPNGWTQENSGSNTGWVTNGALTVSAPNAAYSPAPATVGQANLLATANITSASAQLTFQNFYNTESTWDGMILEIQIGSDPYQEIVAAGGSFVSGNYNTTMNSSSPFGARLAWSGSSTNYINTVVNLPASANGRVVNFRFRAMTDGSQTATGTPGHRIDNVSLSGGTLLSGYDCGVSTVIRKTRADFDGDGKTDLSIFRPTEGNWYLNRSTAGFTALNFGANGDRLTPGDFDGDGKTDLAVARSASGAMTFYIMSSGTNTVSAVNWGATGDVPQVRDFDGDGKADVSVFRNGVWYIRNSGGAATTVTFGQSGDTPIADDYDGDGKADPAVFRAGTWYIQRSNLGLQTVQFGLASDKLVPADYDGDGKVDLAVYRASTGFWYLSTDPATNYGAVQFGASTDIAVPGDYDGDNKADVAVYRNGTWYIRQSTAGSTTAVFGTSTDLPIPAQYIP